MRLANYQDPECHRIRLVTERVATVNKVLAAKRMKTGKLFVLVICGVLDCIMSAVGV